MGGGQIFDEGPFPGPVWVSRADFFRAFWIFGCSTPTTATRHMVQMNRGFKNGG